MSTITQISRQAAWPAVARALLADSGGLGADLPDADLDCREKCGLPQRHPPSYIAVNRYTVVVL